MIDEVRGQMTEHILAMELVRDQLSDKIVECAEVLIAAVASGGKLILMGNGGSAADAQHFAAEMVGRFRQERKAVPAIALTTDTSILTAIGNDYGFEDVFSRQMEALARHGDVVIGISTSGHSANVLKAIHVARQAGCLTIGLLGRDGGKISEVVDKSIVVPLQQTPRIQEIHVLIIHILCDLIEKSVVKKCRDQLIR